MTDSVYLKYQQKLLGSVSEHAVTIVEKSRRTGYSWALAGIAVTTASANKKAGGQNVYYMGYDYEMAREFIEYVGEFAKAMSIVAGEMEEFIFDDPDNPDKEIKAFRVRFASGYSVVALPSVARALRGKQGLVLIDEAAFHDDLPQVLKSAFALLIWGGKVVVVSTHDGEENAFNELLNEVRAGKKPYHIERCTFDDALADGLYKRICKVKGEEWSQEKENAWKKDIVDFYGDDADEELFCIPSQGGGRWLTRSLIERASSKESVVIRWKQPNSFSALPKNLREAEAEDFCRRDILPLLRNLKPDCPSFIGEDFARSGDLTVMWPVQVTSDTKIITPFTVELRNIPFEQQKQILFYICDNLSRFSGGAMDAKGNGAYLAEVAAQKYGYNVIEEVHFTEEWYRNNMPKLKSCFEDNDIIIPKDRDVTDDLRQVVKVRGVARVPEKRTKGTTGARHGDSAIALALAHYASKREFFSYDYDSVGSKSNVEKDEMLMIANEFEEDEISTLNKGAY